MLLAESAQEPSELLHALNETEPFFEYAPGKANTKIAVFSRFSKNYLAPIFETDRLTVRRVNPPGGEEILLAAVHLPSKLHWGEASQSFECTVLANDVLRAEEIAGHQKTVLVGDLNMNPFEPGLVSASGLHAVMDRRIAKTEFRTVQGRRYPYFYNPMWGLLGDGSRGAPGTYFYQKAEHQVYFWNTFDQVVVRPALLDRFRMDDLAIIDHNGRESLLTESGRPNVNVGSDHLPIIFRLSL